MADFSFEFVDHLKDLPFPLRNMPFHVGFSPEQDLTLIRYSTDPKFHGATREEILDRHQDILNQIETINPFHFKIMGQSRKNMLCVYVFGSAESILNPDEINARGDKIVQFESEFTARDQPDMNFLIGVLRTSKSGAAALIRITPATNNIICIDSEGKVLWAPNNPHCVCKLPGPKRPPGGSSPRWGRPPTPPMG